MMLLDVGNTSLRWAFRDIQGLAGQGSFVHRGHEMAGLAGDAWADLESPDSMAVAPARVIISQRRYCAQQGFIMVSWFPGCVIGVSIRS